MEKDEELAVVTLDAICIAATPQHFVTMLGLVERHSMQWLVDAYQARHPNVMAISVPCILSWFPEGDDEHAIIALNGRSWGSVKDRIRGAIESYFR